MAAIVVQNTSFTTPLADVNYGQTTQHSAIIDGVVSSVAGLSAWTVLFTIILSLVAYDQSTIPYISSNIPTNNLIVSYQWQKGSIAGPTFKTPFIGPFLQSMNPKFSEYYAKWYSADLSCVSVFHK